MSESLEQQHILDPTILGVQHYQQLIEENTQLRARLEAAEARLKILDAQDVELPECDAESWPERLIMRDRQLLDALRANKAKDERIREWQEVAGGLCEALRDILRDPARIGTAQKACAAYHALKESAR